MKIHYTLLVLALLLFRTNSYAQEDAIPEKLKQMEQDMVNSKYDIGTVFDTIVIKAIELDSLNIRFQAMLDNHIKTTKKLNKDKHSIVVQLYLLNVNCVDKEDVESVLSLFVENDFGDHIGYEVRIGTLRNNSFSIHSINHYEKTYHYQYKGWNVVFITALNIDFPHAGQLVELKYNLMYKDYVKKTDGKYSFWETCETEVKKTKKYEQKVTFYRLFNHAVEGYKCKCKTKDLYFPFREIHD